jgi:Tfp pilus assembly protein PilO
MESNRVVIAALLFIILIVGINFAMYAIARGATKNSDSRWMSALRNTLSKPMDSSANKSMDELREKMRELEEKKKTE